MTDIVLYDYFRSSACYRVRLVLAFKGIDYHKQQVHMLQEGGQQFKPAYQAINPQSLVPSLQINDQVITQSLAIIHYLDKHFPEPSITPGDEVMATKAMAIAQMINCDIHPLNNLRVLKYLTTEMGLSEQQKQQWYHHWITQGFQAIEKMLQEGSQYCVNEQFTLADASLIPQVYNALRFNVDMTAFPKIAGIYHGLSEKDFVQQAAPQSED